jgi:type I site-specific restriction endonuclease
MRAINEDEGELLIEERLRAKGWNLTDFTLTRKRWPEHLNGEEVDRVFLDELGRAVDVPERHKPITDKYFAILGTRQPVKTIVFAASIAHAKNLRYALIAKYNELNNLPPMPVGAGGREHHRPSRSHRHGRSAA